MKKCPNCKNEVADNAMFCTKCGTKLEEVVEKITEMENVKDEVQEKSVEKQPILQEEMNVQEVEEKQDDVKEQKVDKKEKHQKEKKGNSLGIILGAVCVLAICITICVIVLSKDKGTEIASQTMKTTETATQATTQATTQEKATEEVTETTSAESVASAEGYIVDESMLMSLPGVVGDTYLLSLGNASTEIVWNEIKWENKNPEIVEFDANSGYIKYLAEGTATILATYEGKTYQSTIVVVSKDTSKYPVKIESSMSDVNLKLDGGISYENQLWIDYTVSGEYPDTARFFVQTSNFLNDPLIISSWTDLVYGTFSIGVYPYEKTGKTNVTAILWDPVTKEIYGVNTIPVTVE